MDVLDRKIINLLQAGFPLSEEPYLEVAQQLDIEEQELLDRLSNLLEKNTLSRFGPMYDAQKLGGAFSLVAVRVPEDDFDKVAEIVNSYPEVAHNYKRDHGYNMWYVLATDSPEKIAEVNSDIEKKIGMKVFNMPKLEEYYIGLRLPV
ncbi:MAG: AsnC family transcriptional regulator [Gammaproteobacteria bacterium]|nr:AsnC family transcriptional regulator [Gammaproteobacteria bacterium]